MSEDWTNEKIVALRPLIERPQPSDQPIAVLTEIEAVDTLGGLANVSTILLRGSECTFRCLMCDLWKSTHVEPTPRGAIPKQIQTALEQLDRQNAVSSERGVSQNWGKTL